MQGIRHWVDEVKKRTGKKVLLYTRATVFKPFIQPLGGEVLKDIDLWIARYPNDPTIKLVWYTLRWERFSQDSRREQLALLAVFGPQ